MDEDVSVARFIPPNERQAVAELVRTLADGDRMAAVDEAHRIRAVYATHGLPAEVTERVLQKYDQHVHEREEWPDDTQPDAYLASLRATVTDGHSSIYATFEPDLDDWVVYFVGQTRREWRGPRAGSRVVVLFRRSPQRWITGFQPRRGDNYVEQQRGRWIYRPGAE